MNVRESNEGAISRAALAVGISCSGSGILENGSSPFREPKANKPKSQLPPFNCGGHTCVNMDLVFFVAHFVEPKFPLTISEMQKCWSSSARVLVKCPPRACSCSLDLHFAGSFIWSEGMGSHKTHFGSDYVLCRTRATKACPASSQGWSSLWSSGVWGMEHVATWYLGCV